MIIRRTTLMTALLATFLGATLATAGAPGAAAFEDLQVDQGVDVVGRLVGRFTVRARKIEIQRGMSKKQEITGEIETIDAGARTLRLAGIKVVLSPDAVVEDDDENPVEFPHLKSGQRIKAEGFVGDGAVLRAEEIEVKPAREEPEVGLEARVEKIDAARRTLTVMGFTVLVVPTTKISTE
jgi:hypothetical protein